MESLEKLSKLSTKRLLAYYKKHRNSWLFSNMYWTPEDWAKDKKEYEEHILAVKVILDKREHVEK